MSRRLIHVAAGVITDARDRVLLALRHPDSHQGNLWEFPGGKLEPGESPLQGLRRELREELGLEAISCHPLQKIEHHYPDKSVLLDVWHVTRFAGEPRGQEGQAIDWRPRRELREDDFPAANRAIVQTLRLPAEIAITPRFADQDQSLAYLDHAHSLGVSLVQFRQKHLDSPDYWYSYQQARERARELDLILMANRIDLPAGGLSDGLHASSQQLRKLSARPTADDQLFSASCHSLAELRQAAQLGADFVYLSPVCYTNKYGTGKELGWPTFQALADQVSMPVYALGGLNRADLARAQESGAFGIAGISAFQAA